MKQQDIQRMEQAFKEAREEALLAVELYIQDLFQGKEEGETIPFWFDAFSFWGKSTNGGAEELWSYLHAQDLHTDDWYRAVWSVTRKQARHIALLIEEWEAPWEYDLASKMLPSGEDPMEYYNAYHISFSPATGTEHEIVTNKYGTRSWQQ